MKTFKKFGMLLLAGVLVIAFSACNKEENLAPEQQEYVTVNLGLAGEYVELSESLMETRAGADTTDLIAIKVFALSDKNEESNYAYGVFNSLENVSIKLLAGQRYKFAASILVDGISAEHSDYYSCWTFLSDYNKYTTDGFIYTPNANLSNFSYIDTFRGSDDRKGHEFQHDRFYGELTEYSPTSDGTVRIEAKRVAYGAHYIAEGLTQGSLKIVVHNYDSEWLRYALEIPSTNPESDRTYGFYSLIDAWRGNWNYETQSYVDDYSETKSITISWTKADGSVTPLGAYNVTFKRNVKTTIRIKVEDVSTPNGIVVVRKDTALSPDTNEYVITGGNVIEVPVTQDK